MNDNDIYSIDFTRSLPPVLKNDPKMIALARTIAEQLQVTARQIEKNIIYARIDELDEQTLDVLAYDLHVDWYDYSYPIEVKRQTIKDSVKVHRKLGTKYAVETALGAVYPGTKVQEWFEYGGKPYTFRVIIGAMLRQQPDGSTKLSVRSSPAFDACAICAKLGGGGHKAAAGASLPLPPDHAQAALLQAIYDVYPSLLPQ